MHFSFFSICIRSKESADKLRFFIRKGPLFFWEEKWKKILCMEVPPLLVFQSFVARDDFCSCLGLIEGSSPETRVDGAYVTHCHRRDSPNSLVNVTVLRVPGGAQCFRAKVSSLCAHFPGFIFVFHAELPRNAALQGGRHQKVLLNPRVEDYCSILRIFVNDRQRAFLSTFESSATSGLVRWVPPSPVTHHLREEEELDLDDIFNPTTAAAAAAAEGGGATLSEDDDLQQAIRDSLAEQETLAKKLASEKRPLDQGWDDVLKASSDPIEPGQPICMICTSSRASICFVPCGHAVTCDECLRITRTRTDVCKTCLVCRQEIVTIVRPIWGEVAAVVSEPPTKKRCNKKSRK